MNAHTADDVKTAAAAFKGMQDSINLSSIGIGEFLDAFEDGAAWPIDGDGARCSLEVASDIAIPGGIAYRHGLEVKEVHPYEGPSIVVLSTGYANVWSDGHVTGQGLDFYVDVAGLAEEPS